MTGTRAPGVSLAVAGGRMKFVAVTYGTEGDTRPMALLCRALMDAGHSTHLLADIATLGYAAGLGVPATALDGAIRLAPATEWSPPPALGEFLAAGEPPIYLGFGSMGALGVGRC